MATTMGSRSSVRSGLSERLGLDILELIQDSGMREGERLPAVKELASRYSVATPTVREALGRLEVMGAVEIRHGSGTYVRTDPSRLLFVNPSPTPVSPGIITDLLNARLWIEPNLAAAAADSATAEDIEQLQSTLEEAQLAVGTDDQALLLTNMRFHQLVARASGNRVMHQIMEWLIDLYSSEQTAIITLYNARQEDHEEHLEILSAIRDHDTHRARSVMEKHIKGVLDVVEARLAEQTQPT